MDETPASSGEAVSAGRASIAGHAELTGYAALAESQDDEDRAIRHAMRMRVGNWRTDPCHVGLHC